MATTFHLFPFLPWELRALIWKLTVEPRTVHVHAKRYLLNGARWGDDLNPDSQRAYDRLISTTPVPATLHTCRESRNLGLYQKGLSEVEHVPEGGESRYLWVNFDIDTIDIGWDDPYNYYWAREFIKRLKYRKPDFDDLDLRSFNIFDLVEAHIDVFNEEGLDNWCWTFLPSKLCCDRRNIYLIESENGNRTTTAQVLYEDYIRQQLEEHDEALAAVAAANAEVAQNLEDNNQQGATW
ncbi:hypothetical protein QBC45DRAFT_384877 [Copromyces sp. CBS 386.78]|nr:hypothetical protein QBC45DRAFT_384877 [Copromyces sp. CBS 386.78]